MKESEIATGIRNFLKLNGILCWPIRESAWSYQGLADICGVLPGGRILEIEVKRPGFMLKHPTKQSEHLNQVIQQGGLAFYATSVKEVSDKLRRENIKLRCSI